MPVNSKPNIMLLVGEDVGLHLGCYGEGYAHTPNLDRLAERGCRFDRGYSCAPVCAPSRSALVTGMYPWTVGTHQMRSTVINPPRLFTHELQDAGYNVFWPTKTDFNFVPPSDFAQTKGDAVWLETGKLPDAGDRPFLAFWNFGITHESGMWDTNDQHISFANRTRELPDHLRHDPAKAPVPPYLPDTPEVRLEVSRYFDNLALQDIQIGKALDILEASGQADNTVVIYMTDHGRGLCREKRWPYEAGVHLPLIVRWPGQVKPGGVSDELVSWIDIAPTLLSLAGVPIPSSYQGQVFLGPDAAAPRAYCYSGRDRMDESFDRVRSSRNKQFRYVRNFFPQIPYMQRNKYMEQSLTTQALRDGRAAGTLTPVQAAFMAEQKPVEELYEPANDPHCIRNLADDPAHRDTLLTMRADLEQLLEKTNDLGAVDEPELVSRGLLTNRIETEYRPRIAPLPERDVIGPACQPLCISEAVAQLGPSPTP